MVGSGNVVHDSVRASWKDQDPFKVKCFGVTTLADVVGHWKLYIPVKDNFTGYFNNCQDPDIRAVLLSLSVVSSTKLRCAMLCSQLNTCAVFNYHDQDKSCELLSFGMDPLTYFLTVIASGWE
ncbi:Hypothetical predicted protein [Mytilus galloprovincialis]|uniref:Apple domain-containing protein n=1 Tax=Mytilus galloprovincialis TaxID=29158 RepID=A0A8B6CYM6_MYTGA|nr:Hypothetical predicted protein [Mytilus galloprovincialis]